MSFPKVKEILVEDGKEYLIVEDILGQQYKCEVVPIVVAPAYSEDDDDVEINSIEIGDELFFVDYTQMNECFLSKESYPYCIVGADVEGEYMEFIKTRVHPYIEGGNDEDGYIVFDDVTLANNVKIISYLTKQEIDKYAIADGDSLFYYHRLLIALADDDKVAIILFENNFYAIYSDEFEGKKNQLFKLDRGLVKQYKIDKVRV